MDIFPTTWINLVKQIGMKDLGCLGHQLLHPFPSELVILQLAILGDLLFFIPQIMYFDCGGGRGKKEEGKLSLLSFEKFFSGGSWFYLFIYLFIEFLNFILFFFIQQVLISHPFCTY